MEKRIVSSAEDFSDIPEGGCSLICDCLLACGHHCKKICHVIDREHNNYNCPVTPCDKVMCVLGHKCKKSCFEDCGPCLVIVQRNLPCGHEVHLPCHENYLDYKCTVRVKKVIPDCKHENEMDCWMNPSKFTCLVPCTSRLDDCGHTCRLKCHVNKDPDHLDYKCKKPCPLTNAQCSKDHPCTKRCYEECGLCEEIVVKESPACGHKNKMPCHLDPIQFDCLDKCERTMKCGHKCKNSCYEPCDGCNVVVEKTIPDCGHKIKLRCSTVPERSMCRKPCERTLDCGHTCKLECGKTCEIECKEFVESHTVAGCGHVVQLPCYKRAGIQSNSEELLSYCRMKCNADLQCGHKCLGTCYDCLQGRIHVPCKMNCGRILICGHKCGTPCASSCPPCNKKCEMRCYHNRCNKTCGQPCTPCSEKCNWICEHYKCTKRCSEPCNRPPCEHPCKKKLKCGHPCIGFCGEPCPRLCRICNKEEVTTIKLGSEDEDDARFVLLEDCSHIVEARDLEYWLLVSNKGEITIAQCPLCKTTIKRNRRYSNIIKERYKAICEVKTKVFGEKKRIMNSRNVYFQKIRPWKEFVDFRTGTFNRPKFGRPTRQEVPYTVLLDTKNFKLLVDFLFESLNIRGKKNRKNTWSNNDMETLGIQTDILCEMAENVHKIEYVLIPETKSILLTYMDVILKVLRARIRCLSSEEVDNLNLEAQRFHRIVTMCALESVPNFRKLSLESKKRYMLTVHNPLLSINKYSAEQDNVLKAELEKFLKDVGGLTITTDVERKQIVKALGMRPGHWFKCPNGHFYIITECGGAMEVGRCNECGAQIGGEDHALLTTNRHASEMDNSKFPAWSEAANLANFDLNLML
ncbi:hypothetical protein C0J52_05539 [Blattella germanica]|nr:hypothetical protein C0J52_05539 [Blattella germanica]